MNNPLFVYGVREWAARIKNESPADAAARIEKQRNDDARIEAAMRAVVGNTNGEDF